MNLECPCGWTGTDEERCPACRKDTLTAWVPALDDQEISGPQLELFTQGDQ